jgi:hypothetical protein
VRLVDWETWVKWLGVSGGQLLVVSWVFGLWSLVLGFWFLGPRVSDLWARESVPPRGSGWILDIANCRLLIDD